MAGSNKPKSRGVVAWLVDPAKTRIRRHVEMRSHVNPFNPTWRGYFEAQRSLKRTSSQT